MLAGSAVGAIWGDGTYFARDAKYSHDYTEPKDDVLTNQSQRKMLLNRVIVGEWVKGAPGMLLYPLAKGEKYRQCNSLVNDVGDPSIFVIQHSNQAYPAYVITYTSA
jgi:poly [ADP-ribose] polymerase 7/11/12/13